MIPRATSLLRLLALLLTAIFGFHTAPGQEEATGAGAEEIVAPPENTEADDADATIKAYLETIFANVDELQEVKVSVKNGVVRLSGSTNEEVSRNKAESVAKEIEGVVYVDNDISQTTDVVERLSPRLKRVNQFLDSLRALLPLIGVAAGVMILAWFVSRVAAWMFEKAGLLRGNQMLRNIVGNLLRVAIILIGLYIALEIVGATAIVGAVLGAAGVAGLAISFAFRDIIENYLASVILSLRQPFAIKDRVEINGKVGRVMRLTSSETVLMTDDGNHCRLPNSEVFKGTITNFTRNPRRRLHFTVGIGTDEDLESAEAIGVGILDQIEGVLGDPNPTCLVLELGDSSVIIGFYAWVDQSKNDFGKVKSFAIRSVKEALDEAGISMPAPGYELKVHQVGDDREPQEPRPRSRRASPSKVHEEVDLSPETHIDSQIDAEQALDPDDNLLKG